MAPGKQATQATVDGTSRPMPCPCCGGKKVHGEGKAAYPCRLVCNGTGIAPTRLPKAAP